MKPNKITNRMSFGMWLSFTLLATGIAGLFWVVLETSFRVNYKNENMEVLDRAIWAAMEKYTSPEFEDNLRFIAGSGEYFIQLVSEREQQLLLALDNQGQESQVQAEGIIPDNLFDLLDEGKGFCSYCIEDTVRNVEWAVEAMVVANQEGYRIVLVFSKSLANVSSLIHPLRARAVFALFVVLVIASCLSLMITRRFAGPINRLTEMAKQLAEGNYAVAFPKGGCYEVEQLSETLEMAAKEFNATEALRREFVANISHDMKTPLTVIKMYAEMIQTVSGENKIKREAHLERIITEVEKLNGLISDTMELAKLQSGTWELKMETFDLSHLVRSARLSFAVHQESRELQIDLETEEGLYVYADRKLISRVLENFISNAVKFSGDMKKIRIKTKREYGMIKTTVQDFGAGIEVEKLPYIWERYYKVDPFGTNKSGTGVGLHIVKEILQMHQAQYGVSSEPGKGSCFWFRLKAAKW